MKKYIIKWSFLILLTTFITSCNDDFLERAPLDSLSEQTFFNSATDIQTYVNGLYGQLPRYNFQAGYTETMNLFLDGNSDLMINDASITGGLDRVGNSGLAPVNSGDWNGRFDLIRQVNYFLAHYGKVKRDAVSNQFIGEGYFFRAWNYYSFLVDYGDLPYVTEPLNVDSKELYRPRDSRYDVAKRIIQDLDSAIVNLSWKGVGEAKSGRVNKEAALVMKARVALFEGSWEYYHGKASTKFSVSGKDGKDILGMVEPAIQALIDRQGTNIFRGGGKFNEPYNQLFAQDQGAVTAGAFLYRIYDTKLLTVSHNFYEKIIDTGASITKRLADMYLDVTGVPQSISVKSLASLNEMGQNLDPRFRQTIWTPDRGPMTKIAGRTAQGNYAFRYPLIAPGVGGYTSTGFRNWKGAIFVESEYRAGNTDDILIRYAEGLLAYAEAKAILGTISQADLDKTVNVLRGRVGMVPMNLSTVNSWSATYSTSEGFDPTASNVVNEIRRERTVELATEGFRLTDLKRWAVFEKAINGYKPKGARLQEFLDYFNNPATLKADGWFGSNDLSLTVGKNVNMDADGYINPYFRSTQFQNGGAGFYVDKDRDYLSPVPTSEIDLYNQSGITLTQNPGWR